MLGDISPQTVRITQQAVVYPGRDHVTSLRVERFDGRTYKPVDMTAVNRVILSFPEADPVIVYDSAVQAVFTHVGTTLTVDLSDYAMPASVLGCQIILYDAEHPAGQVLVDDIDAVVQFDFRNVSPVGGIPAPAVDYLTDAPIDGVTYARKDGVWVPVDAMVSGVSSVNGQSGVVVLDAADVGADAAGTATTAAAAAVAAHTVLADPHPQYLTPAEGNVAYERVLTAGTNVTIDRTNPSAPVINASGGGGGGAVDSVNGQTGVVVLDTDDLAEGVSNLYFTNGRAAAAAPVQTVDGQTGAVSLSSSYAPLSHVGAGGAAHSNAVAAGAAGFMTGADKTKLDGIATGATQNSSDAFLLTRGNHTGTQTASTISDFASASRAQTEAELVAGTNVTITPSGSGATRQLTIAAAGGGGSTNLSTTTSTTTLTVNSDTGTDAVLPAATPSVAGVLTAADKTKLDGIATGATQNSSDAFLLTRGNHTGTQTASTISDFTEATQDIVGSSVVAGANVTVTYDDGTGLTTVAASSGGGGLTNFTEAKTTASPNATIPVVSLTATSAEANVDFALIPKGSGALITQVPDGSTTGGGKRGIYSVDLQRSRTGSTAVAEGQYAVVAGGANNRAAGNYSVSAGGQSNNVSAPHAVSAGGLSNTVSGSYGAVPGGQSNNCSGQWGAIGGGQGNVVDSTWGYIPGGAYATTRGADGAEAYSSGRFSSTGDSQRRRLIVAIATSSATATKLTSDRAAAGSTNQLKLVDNSTYAFTAKVVARSSSDQGGWSVSGLITRGSGVATTILVGSPVVTSLGASAGASSWSVSATADTSFGALSISATGAAGVSVKWVADIETVEAVG